MGITGASKNLNILFFSFSNIPLCDYNREPSYPSRGEKEASLPSCLAFICDDIALKNTGLSCRHFF